MPHRDDYSYFKSRADKERAIASTCEDNAVALAHLKMAEAYEHRVSEAGNAQPASGRERFA